MKLANWQKNEIIMPINEIVLGRSNDYNTVWDAIEKACSGGMRTNGPDRVSQNLREEIEFAALESGQALTPEQLGAIIRATRKLIADLFDR